jgi:two-component system cell cycle response regulator
MRVLIADDNQDWGQSLALLLQLWGYEPVVVYDGLAAMACLREPDGPTLALLDGIMPGLNGIDICRVIRREEFQPYRYVIMVTGQGGKNQMLDGLHAGADDYLVKPVDPLELHARLSTAKRILDLQAQLFATQRLLRQQATHDTLTGVGSRAMILDVLQRELTRSQRQGHPLAVIMADLDHFKKINDTYGHLAGDSVLRQTAQRLRAVLRLYDTVGRYGGEEFLIVLPDCGAGIAAALAERLRTCVAAEPVTDGDHAIHVTVSLGLAACNGEMPPEELLRIADKALYDAKRAGRNRVAGGEPGSYWDDPGSAVSSLMWRAAGS